MAVITRSKTSPACLQYQQLPAYQALLKSDQFHFPPKNTITEKGLQLPAKKPWNHIHFAMGYDYAKFRMNRGSRVSWHCGKRCFTGTPPSITITSRSITGTPLYQQYLITPGALQKHRLSMTGISPKHPGASLEHHRGTHEHYWNTTGTPRNITGTPSGHPETSLGHHRNTPEHHWQSQSITATP